MWKYHSSWGVLDLCWKIFSSFCLVLMWSQKKTKKQVIALMDASFSPILRWSPEKKKVLRLSSIQERGAMGFWRETKMPEKFCTFLRLKGTLNTSTFSKMVTGTAVLFKKTIQYFQLFAIIYRLKIKLSFSLQGVELTNLVVTISPKTFKLKRIKWKCKIFICAFFICFFRS